MSLATAHFVHLYVEYVSTNAGHAIPQLLIEEGARIPSNPDHRSSTI